MDKSLSFDIEIPEGRKVKLTQESTFEHFVAQFQPYTSKLLCVVDGTSLCYYDKSRALPANIRFDYKQRRGSVTEYYFRDIDKNTLYCVFGREAARTIYPRIDHVDPINNSEPPLEPIVPSRPGLADIPINKPGRSKMPLFHESHPCETTSKHIVIIDKGVRLKFPNPDYPVEIRTYYPE